MKKIISVLIVLTLILAASACNPIPFEGQSKEFDAAYRELDKDIQAAEDKYKDSDGYIPEDKKDEALSEIVKLAEQKLKDGEIAGYEEGSDSVYVELNDGTGYIYLPQIEGMDSSTGELKIVTMQPCYSGYPNKLSTELKYVDDAARQVDDFSDSYSFYYDDSSKDDDCNDDEVTLEALIDFPDYSIIIWHGHGGYNEELHSFIVTGVKDSNRVREKYSSDFYDGSIFPSNGSLIVTSKFFEKHLKNGSLENSLIYLGTCSSGADSVLSDTFLEKGAGAVFANSGAIYTVYNLSMIKSVFDAYTEDGDVTAAEALAAAWEENGRYNNYKGTGQTSTEALIYGNGTMTLSDNIKTGNGAGNTSGNIANGGLAAQSDGWIYYCGDDGSIYKMKNDGSGETKLNSEDSSYINIVDGWVYYIAGGSSEGIIRMRTDGSERMQLLEARAWNLIFLDGWAYFLEDGRIFRMRTDGTDKQELPKQEEGSISSFALENETVVYYNLWDTEDEEGYITYLNISRMNIDGSGFEVLDTEIYRNGRGDWFYNLQLVDGTAYYLFGGGGQYVIRKADLGSGALQEIPSEELNYFCLNLQDDGFYCFSAENIDEGCTLLHMDTGGSAIEKLGTLDGWLEDYYNLCIAGDWLFYQTWDGVSRVRIGGSNTEAAGESSASEETIIVSLREQEDFGFDTELYNMYEVEGGYMLTCCIEEIYMLTFDEYTELAEGHVVDTAVGEVIWSSETMGYRPDDVFSFVDIEWEDDGYYIMDIPGPGQEVPIYSVWLKDPITYKTDEKKEFFISRDAVVRIIDYDPWFKEISFDEYITTPNFTYDFRYYAKIKGSTIIEMEEMYEP